MNLRNVFRHSFRIPKILPALTKLVPEPEKISRGSYDGIKAFTIDPVLLRSAQTTENKHLEGVHTVLLLDISESMKHAWSEVKTFCYDYISGLDAIREQYGLNDEHVAIATFGHETMVQLRLSNDYKRHLQIIECLKVGGPTSFIGGLLMAVAAVAAPDSKITTVGHLSVGPRIILISDGHFSEPTQEKGPDIPVANSKTLGLVHESILSSIDIESDAILDMIFVPVGNANMENLESMRLLMRGTMLTYKDGGQMARRTLITVVVIYVANKTAYGNVCGPVYCYKEKWAADPFGQGPAKKLHLTLSERDRKDIAVIEEKARLTLDHPSRRQCNYQERNDDALPPPGSRVRRGPDWKYGHERDQLIPGTIVGHVLEAPAVWVNWDTHHDPTPYRYRYGENGAYDVLLVDEPVILRPGTLLTIGCFVEPGPGWQGVFQPATKGSVLRLNVDDNNVPRALVRWSRQEQGDYTYMYTGDDSLPEIIVCSTSRAKQSVDKPVESQASLPPTKTATTRTVNKNKNKNKNT